MTDSQEEINYAIDFQKGKVLCNPFVYLHLENHSLPGIAVNSYTLQEFLDGGALINHKDLRIESLIGKKFLSVYSVTSPYKASPDEESDLPPWIVDFDPNNLRGESMVFMGYMSVERLGGWSESRKAKEYFENYLETLPQLGQMSLPTQPDRKSKEEPVPEDDTPF